jgi:ESF2/ABP1 family protein
MESGDENNEESPSTSEKEKTAVKPKVSKPGIIYLSKIPPKMNVTHIREFFSQFGEIHRSFLQPDKTKTRKGKKNQTFTEGWIEFKKRKHAKRVAATLNNTPLGGKKKKQNYDFLWNIKYLPGLQWVHINERLAYERISRQQKMRAEISAAKRETSFFAKSVGLNKKLKRTGYRTQEADPDVEPDEPSVEESVMKPGESEKSREIPKSRLKLFQSFFPQESS